LRIGPSGTLLIVLGLAAVALPPLALWVDNESEQDLLDAREAEREVSLARLGALEAETSLRGYILTGDEQFREPYELGVQNLTQAASRLRELLGEPPGTTVDSLEEAFETWREEWAEPRMALVEAGDMAAAQDVSAVASAQLLFEGVEASADALSEMAAGQISEAEDDRGTAELWQFALIALAGLAAAGFVGMVAFVFSSRRRGQVELGAMRRELASERELSVRSWR
jgi:CHASE3 domain sensor protein